MKLRILQYKIVNGFKIIRDDGRIGRKRVGRAICKECGKEFECDIYDLKYRKGCGCINPCPMPKMEESINGFQITKDLGRVNGNRRVIVRCKACFIEFQGQVQNLKLAKSCGCLKGKKILCSYKQSHPRLFRIYKNMIKRCYDAKHKSYHNYGERGITISVDWRENPDSFCTWALKNGYEENLTLDRINGSKNYEAENCRWATVTEQNRNARTNVLNEEIVKMIRSENRSLMTVQQIADKYNLARGTVSSVLNFNTWRDI